MPNLNDIIAYESGELDYDQVIELFRSIRDTGAYTWLQGHYGRTLAALEAEGAL